MYSSSDKYAVPAASTLTSSAATIVYKLDVALSQLKPPLSPQMMTQSHILTVWNQMEVFFQMDLQDFWHEISAITDFMQAKT